MFMPLKTLSEGKFFARTNVNTKRDVNGREHLCAMDPADFERLIADYFLRRGFVRAEVIGHSGGRGVDVVATNTHWEIVWFSGLA